MIAADLQRLQLQVPASDQGLSCTHPCLTLLQNCGACIYGFAPSASDKNAYTVLSTEFIKDKLRIRSVPSMKVQQLLHPELSFAVVLLQSAVSDVERILVAAAQCLDANSLIRNDWSKTKAARVSRACAWAQQQIPAVARCAWQARSERSGSIVSVATEQNSPNLQRPIAQMSSSFSSGQCIGRSLSTLTCCGHCPTRCHICSAHNTCPHICCYLCPCICTHTCNCT